MGQFLTELELTPLPDGKNWDVDEDFSYKDDAGEIINVPKGRVTDLASTPRILWNVYPPFGRYVRSAVIHDELYTDGRFSKEKSDLIFYEAMKADNVSPTTAWILYHAVKWFGSSAWLRHRKEDSNAGQLSTVHP